MNVDGYKLNFLTIWGSIITTVFLRSSQSLYSILAKQFNSLESIPTAAVVRLTLFTGQIQKNRLIHSRILKSIRTLFVQETNGCRFSIITVCAKTKICTLLYSYLHSTNIVAVYLIPDFCHYTVHSIYDSNLLLHSTIPTLRWSSVNFRGFG